MSKKLSKAEKEAAAKVVEALQDKAAQLVDPNTLVPWDKNPRVNDHAVPKVAASIEEFGFAAPIIARAGTNVVIAGHTRLKAALHLGLKQVPVRYLDITDKQAAQLAIADNKLGELATWDDAMLADIMTDFDPGDLELTGFSTAELDAIMGGFDTGNSGGTDGPRGPNLAERFGVPPFSVLDARQGYWRARKAQWLEVGIQSELGRDGKLAYDLREWERSTDGSGTSVFDPVLCELVYRWFSPAGGAVLDPFAGGSVRGVIAAVLGRAYTGIELRGEQVEANREQWGAIGPRFAGEERAEVTDPEALTPVEQRGDYWLKRDDLLCIGGVNGGKVRSCWALAQGARGLVTAGSLSSPQVNIVAHVAQHLGVPCRVHCPGGELTGEVQQAIRAGAHLEQHTPGYIIKRARDDAKERDWRNIPFGMECKEAVTQTRKQAANLPAGPKRIVIPVGSGMSLAGVLHGLRDANNTTPVVGVVVGADPTKRLDKYAPKGWREQVTLVESSADYADSIDAKLEGVKLDSHYEAKCLEHLQPGDLLWVVGIRQVEAQLPGAVAPTWVQGDSAVELETMPDESADLVFTCPPYGDLEVYSDDPADLSNMHREDMLDAYGDIAAKAVAKLRPDRFCVVVVGDYRGKDGNLSDFVSATIAAFEEGGARLYNEAVLITPAGSLPVRTRKPFEASRKLGKSHQNVLVFVKGDAQAATAACGTVDVDFGEVLA